MHRICNAAIGLILLLTCSEREKHHERESGMKNANQSGAAAKLKLLTIDSVFQQKKGIHVFCKRLNSGEIEQVHGGHWPDSIDVVYNVCMNEHNVVLLFKEIPRIESGDFSIVNTYYFLDGGNTFAAKSQTTFFDEGCSDGAIQESRTRFYDHDGQTYMTEYSLTDEGGNPLDSSKCGFGDLPDFKMYRNLAETPAYSKVRVIQQ